MAIYYVGVPLLMIVAVLDATVMRLFQLWDGALSPNLMLMVVVSWALVVELQEGLAWAVIGGILRDLLSVAPTGSSALAFVLIVIVIDMFIPKLGWRNVVIPPVAVGAATFFYDIVLFILLQLVGYSRPFFYGLSYASLPGAVENVILMVFVFRAVAGVNAFFRPPRATAF